MLFVRLTNPEMMELVLREAMLAFRDAKTFMVDTAFEA